MTLVRWYQSQTIDKLEQERVKLEKSKADLNTKLATVAQYWPRKVSKCLSYTFTEHFNQGHGSFWCTWGRKGHPSSQTCRAARYVKLNFLIVNRPSRNSSLSSASLASFCHLHSFPLYVSHLPPIPFLGPDPFAAIFYGQKDPS